MNTKPAAVIPDLNLFVSIISFSPTPTTPRMRYFSSALPWIFSWLETDNRLTRWACGPSSLHLLMTETGDYPELGNGLQLCLAARKKLIRVVSSCYDLTKPYISVWKRHLHAFVNALLEDISIYLRSFPALVDTLWFDFLSKSWVYFSIIFSELVAWSCGSERGWRRTWEYQWFPMKRHWCRSNPLPAIVGFL